MHTIPPDVYRACESVGVTQETHDHNYFRTRSVVNEWRCAEKQARAAIHINKRAREPVTRVSLATA